MDKLQSTHIAHISDTTDDPAKAKLVSAYLRHARLNGIRDHAFSPVPAFNSMDIGFNASELLTNAQRADILILSGNCAPPNNPKGAENNIRNDFFCAALGEGATFCGTNNGFEFSYVRPRIIEFYRLINTNHLHSQFRSLDILPEYSVPFADPDKRERLVSKGVLEPLDDIRAFVPEIPDATHVVQVDNFGNVKLYVSEKDRALLERCLKRNNALYFAFAKTPFRAAVSSSFFAGETGSNIITLNSSSTLADGRSVPMIATLRSSPGQTPPAYGVELPSVGDPARLSRTRRTLSQNCSFLSLHYE